MEQPPPTNLPDMWTDDQPVQTTASPRDLSVGIPASRGSKWWKLGLAGIAVIILLGGLGYAMVKNWPTITSWLDRYPMLGWLVGNNTTNNESIKEVKETDTSCSEPQAATEPADTTILIYPCKGMGKKEWELKESKLKQYQESFPAIDILQHCKNARQWCIDNPSRQKTYSGMPKFLSKWLTKEQNKGGYNVGKDKPRNIQPEVGKYDNLKTIR